MWKIHSFTLDVFLRPRNLRLQGVWRGMWQLWENAMEVCSKDGKDKYMGKGGGGLCFVMYDIYQQSNMSLLHLLNNLRGKSEKAHERA